MGIDIDRALERLYQYSPESDLSFAFFTALTAVVEISIFQDSLLMQAHYSYETNQKRKIDETLSHKLVRWVSIQEYYSQMPSLLFLLLLLFLAGMIMGIAYQLRSDLPLLAKYTHDSVGGFRVQLFSWFFFYFEWLFLLTVAILFDTTACYKTVVASESKIDIEDMELVKSTVKGETVKAVLVANSGITCNSLSFYLAMFLSGLASVLGIFILTLNFKLSNLIPNPSLPLSTVSFRRYPMLFLTVLPLFIRNLVVWTGVNSASKQGIYLNISAVIACLLFVLALNFRPYLRRRSNSFLVTKQAFLATVSCLSALDYHQDSSDKNLAFTNRTFIFALLFAFLIRISKNIMDREEPSTNDDSVLKRIVAKLWDYKWSNRKLIVGEIHDEKDCQGYLQSIEEEIKGLIRRYDDHKELKNKYHNLLIILYQDYLKKSSLSSLLLSTLKYKLSSSESPEEDEMEKKTKPLFDSFRWGPTFRDEASTSSLKKYFPDLGHRVLFYKSARQLAGTLTEPVTIVSSTSIGSLNFSKGTVLLTLMEDLQKKLRFLIEKKMSFVDHLIKNGYSAKATFTNSLFLLRQKKLIEELFGNINNLTNSKFVPSLLLQGFYSRNILYRPEKFKKLSKEIHLWRGEENRSFFDSLTGFDSCVFQVTHEPTELGNILWVSSSCQSLLGFSQKSLIGTSINLLVPEPVRKNHKKMMTPSKMKGSLLESSEFRNLAIRTSKGSIRDMCLCIKLNADLTRGLRSFGFMMFTQQKNNHNDKDLMIIVVDDRGKILETNQEAGLMFCKNSFIEEYSPNLMAHFRRLLTQSEVPTHYDGPVHIKAMETLISSFKSYCKLTQGVKIGFKTKQNQTIFKNVQFFRKEYKMAKTHFNEIRILPYKTGSKNIENAALFRRSTVRSYFDRCDFAEGARNMLKTIVQNSSVEEVTRMAAETISGHKTDSTHIFKQELEESENEYSRFRTGELRALPSELNPKEFIVTPRSQLGEQIRVQSSLSDYQRGTTHQLDDCIIESEIPILRELSTAQLSYSNTDKLSPNTTSFHYQMRLSISVPGSSRKTNIHSVIGKCIEEGSVWRSKKGTWLLSCVFLLLMISQLAMTFIKYHLKFLIVGELSWKLSFMDDVGWIIYSGPTRATSIEPFIMEQKGIIADDYFIEYFGEGLYDFIDYNSGGEYPYENTIKYFDRLEHFRKDMQFPYFFDSNSMTQNARVDINILPSKMSFKASPGADLTVKEMSLREAVLYLSMVQGILKDSWAEKDDWEALDQAFFETTYNIYYEGMFKYLYPYTEQNTEITVLYFERISLLYRKIHYLFEVTGISSCLLITACSGLFFFVWRISKDNLNRTLFQLRMSEVYGYREELMADFRLLAAFSEGGETYRATEKIIPAKKVVNSRKGNFKVSKNLLEHRGVFSYQPNLGENGQESSHLQIQKSKVKLKMEKSGSFSYGLWIIWFRIFLAFIPLICFYSFFIYLEFPNSLKVYNSIQYLMALNRLYNYMDLTNCALVDMISREGQTKVEDISTRESYVLLSKKLKNDVFPVFLNLQKNHQELQIPEISHFTSYFNYCYAVKDPENFEETFYDPDCSSKTSPWFNGNLLEVAINIFKINEELFFYLDNKVRTIEDDRDFLNSPRIKAVLNMNFRSIFVEHFFFFVIEPLSSHIKSSVHAQDFIKYKECYPNCNHMIILMSDSKARTYFFSWLLLLFIISLLAYNCLAERIQILLQSDLSTCLLLSPSLLSNNHSLRKLLNKRN